MNTTKVNILFFTLMVAGITLVISSCGCPDYDENGEELLVLTADINDADSTWIEQVREKSYNFRSLRQELLITEEEAHVKGNRILVANRLYDYQTGMEIPLPDSLKECNFGNEKNSMICAVTNPDSLYNAYLDTTLNIENAISKLYEIEVSVSGNALEILKFELLIEDKAEYQNDDRYSIATYHNPKYDAESNQIFVQKSTEIREFVLDSAGTIVNDILFYRELEQLANTNTEFVTLFSYGSLNSNEVFPKFNRSLTSQKYTFSYRGDVYIQDFDSEEPQLLRPGIRPVFFDGGTKLVYWKEDESIEIYDLTDESHFYISGQNKAKSPVVRSEDSDIIYYLSNSGVHSFDTSSKEGTLMMGFSNYVEERERENENLNLRLNPVELFFNAESPNNLTVLIFSDYSIYVTCE